MILRDHISYIRSVPFSRVVRKTRWPRGDRRVNCERKEYVGAVKSRIKTWRDPWKRIAMELQCRKQNMQLQFFLLNAPRVHRSVSQSRQIAHYWSFSLLIFCKKMSEEYKVSTSGHSFSFSFLITFLRSGYGRWYTNARTVKFMVAARQRRRSPRRDEIM